MADMQTNEGLLTLYIAKFRGAIVINIMERNFLHSWPTFSSSQPGYTSGQKLVAQTKF